MKIKNKNFQTCKALSEALLVQIIVYRVHLESTKAEAGRDLP